MTNSKKFFISPYTYPGMRFSEEDRKNLDKLPRIDLTKEYIMEVISKECEVTIQSLSEKTRKQEVVQARHIYCAIAKKYMKLSLKNIGQTIGGRDHTTILHAIRTFEERIVIEEQYQNKVNKIYQKLGIL